MAYKIDKETCLGCGACASECPAEAISCGEDGKYVIDENACLECGACADACPVGAPKA
ncbi:MAG: 4Fe-4S binding protein [Clostridia bacterium]|nr:4Fe-4S binding protein [Clostridia bacterium]